MLMKQEGEVRGETNNFSERDQLPKGAVKLEDTRIPIIDKFKLMSLPFFLPPFSFLLLLSGVRIHKQN